MAVTSALAVGTRERGEAAAWQSLSVHCVGYNETQNWLTIQKHANVTYTKVPAGYSQRAQRS